MNEAYRKTHVEINLLNLYFNYKSVEKRLNGKKIIPVVKANAYGHGVIDVVNYLVNNDIDHFAVSTLEEAIELRRVFNDIDILVMGVIQKEYFSIASKENITLTISNFDQINGLENYEFPLKIHLKIDTGMNRLGFKSNDSIIKAFETLKNNENIVLEGLYSHLATADNNKKYYDKQLMRFQEVFTFLDYPFEMVHISNSSSAIKYESSIDFTTHVRLGISLYGLTLDEETTFLRNTYKLITHIVEFKHLKPGEKVGYGATYTATEKEIIGVLPIGYADGFIRQNQGGFVEINENRYQIVGRICMDQMFIKVDEKITKKDEVIIFGGIISIDEVANRLNTINYEIICQVTYRVPKIYIK